jgi:hypothetical protein
MGSLQEWLSQYAESELIGYADADKILEKWDHLVSLYLRENEKELTDLEAGELESLVEAFLYQLAVQEQYGTARLDQALAIIKSFSAWCAKTNRLPFDFARSIPFIGKEDRSLQKFIREKWGLHDMFYGIPSE